MGLLLLFVAIVAVVVFVCFFLVPFVIGDIKDNRDRFLLLLLMRRCNDV